MAKVPLTAALVRQAACPARQIKIDLFDLNQKGFLLEVRASGGKTYYQRYTDERGRTRQFKIGSADVLNLSVARQKGREIVAQSLLGNDPRTRRLETRSIPTLANFAKDRFLPHVQSYKRSWKTDETILRVHILPALGPKYLDEISAEAIATLVQQMTAAGYATGTTNRVVILLRHIYNVAKRWQVPGSKHNPTTGIKLAPDVNRERFLSVEETGRLIHSIEQDENQVAAKAILLLLLTGARRNEITHATWSNLDWSKKTLFVPLSKSGKSRSITLNTLALSLLKSIEPVPENPFVFPSPVTGKPSPSLHFPWERIRARAGLQDLRLHDLRHSFASFLVNKGISLYIVQGLLGHQNSRYTQRYAHLTTETLLDAAEAMTAVASKR
jgi:integrase